MSVVLPTYSRPAFLREAVDSVRRQTYDRLELVVVDDASPEPVEPLLPDDIGPNRRLRCLRHAENAGGSAARNTGLRAAEGELIAFLDDDDRWHPEKVARQVAAFDRAGDDVGVVYTGQEFTVDGDRVSAYQPTVRGDVTADLLRGATMATFSAVMVCASVVDTVGGLDERFPCWQDREWLLRVSRAYEFERVDGLLAVRRSTDHEQISDDFEAKRDIAYPLFLDRFRPLAASYGPEYERGLIAARSRAVGKSAVQQGYYRDARRFLLRALRYDPTADPEAYGYLLATLGGEAGVKPIRRLYRYVP